MQPIKQEQLHARAVGESRQICREHPLSLRNFIAMHYKMFDLETEDQIDDAQLSAKVPFDGKYQSLRLQNTLHISALAFTLTEILAFPIFYLANLGRVIQHSQ